MQSNVAQINGHMIIGKKEVFGNAGTYKAIDPSTKNEIEPAFGLASNNDIELACNLAQNAFDQFRSTSPEQRAIFLEQIAEEILALGSTLIGRAAQETGLPIARLEGERGRTMNQLKLFAKVVRDGHYLGAKLDSALPNRVPPRADIRLQKIAIGPVAVFGASNFPLAFSVAGGDTASALAAGCPVVVKAHSAHLGTSELVARAIQKAARACDMPEGVFSLIIGNSHQTGQNLVSHEAIKAVGFTGSRQGGLALMKVAAQRAEPIPVFAEMSSINPVFILPSALANTATTIATAFIDSLTLGAGQFCTNPGLIIAIDSPELNVFLETAKTALSNKPSATMLTPEIHQAYCSGVEKISKVTGVEVQARSIKSDGNCTAQALLVTCNAQQFLMNSELEDEVFGPTSLLIKCKNFQEMEAVAQKLEGQLTATVHALPEDFSLARHLLPILERKAGRILFNGFPTGVEVCDAMVHGGPFPSTSDSRSTSVGSSAIDRFTRPVCYQDVPADLLPSSLQDNNPLNIARIINGKLIVS